MKNLVKKKKKKRSILIIIIFPQFFFFTSISRKKRSNFEETCFTSIAGSRHFSIIFRNSRGTAVEREIRAARSGSRTDVFFPRRTSWPVHLESNFCYQCNIPQREAPEMARWLSPRRSLLHPVGWLPVHNITWYTRKWNKRVAVGMFRLGMHVCACTWLLASVLFGGFFCWVGSII